jgi:pimeloyl-ACP methyl ester carboxylesterase
MFPDPVIIKVGGRDVAVEDSGPGSGFPIFMMNGAGSRHLFAPAVREGRDLGFRLIGYDRAGCGASTSRPGRVIADCADDLRAIMTELGISRAATWGSSGGGPYALAAAATMPDAIAARVRLRVDRALRAARPRLRRRPRRGDARNDPDVF